MSLVHCSHSPEHCWLAAERRVSEAADLFKKTAPEREEKATAAGAQEEEKRGGKEDTRVIEKREGMQG